MGRMSDIFFGKVSDTPEAGRQAPDSSTPVDPKDELGVAGVKIASGFVYDEYIPNLQGERGRKTYREMKDNDATVGAILFAIEMLLRAVDWRVEYDYKDDSDDKEAEDKTTSRDYAPDGSISDPQEAVAFLNGLLFDDMNHTWDEFIASTLSMLPYGWQYTEIVWKKRNGSNVQKDNPKSIYEDGLIGIHKLADRSQETLDRWDQDYKGNIYGMWQQPPQGGPRCYIPIEKALHFRPHPFKDSPEGRSILRTSYRSWYFLKNIQGIEATGIERELNGLPVVYIPNAILNSKEPEDQAAVGKYNQLVRDVKLNNQGGIVLPSDPYYDGEGKPTGTRQVQFELVSSSGTRAIDTDKVIRRYQGDIARTVLADFLMFGTTGSGGNRSLGETRLDLFLRAGSGWLGSIAAVLNRDLIPKIWKVNGLDPEIMPYITPGKIAPEDLAKFGKFLTDMSSAGIMLNDPETEDFIREVGGLPISPIIDDDEVTIPFEEEEEIKPVDEDLP